MFGHPYIRSGAWPLRDKLRGSKYENESSLDTRKTQILPI